MIKANDLISLFQTMYKEHWKYEWGSATGGCVDCSGAFSYSFSKLGGKIPHGSNSIARKSIVKLLPVSMAQPGMAAFKVRSWAEKEVGNTWYGTEPGDVYHVGLVDDDPGYVLNAKSKKVGFSRDSIKSWSYVGYLKGVDYGGAEQMEEKEAVVVLPSGTEGTTVNLRDSPGGSLVERIHVGSVVTVLDDQGEWMKVQYGMKTGYMMSNFLEYVGQDTDGEVHDNSVRLTDVDVAQIDEALKQIDRAMELIGSIVGRG